MSRQSEHAVRIGGLARRLVVLPIPAIGVTGAVPPLAGGCRTPVGYNEPTA